MERNRHISTIHAARLVLAALMTLCWSMPVWSQKQGYTFGLGGWVYTANFYKIDDGVLHIYNNLAEAQANGVKFSESDLKFLKKAGLADDTHLEMPKFGERYGNVTPPWRSYADEIKVIWVHGDNWISDFAFADMPNVEQVLAGMVTSVGCHAFTRCGTPDLVLYLPNVHTVYSRGLNYCNARIIDLPTCKSIHEDGISYCPNLELIHLGGAPFIEAGGLAYNPKLVRAEGNNRPSVFLTNEKCADYRNDYAEEWYMKVLHKVWNPLVNIIKKWIGKGEDAADTWIGVPLLSNIDKETEATDKLFEYLEDEWDLDEDTKACSPFGNVTNGEINVVVPPALLSKYVKFYSKDMAGEKASSGYMTYNHKKAKGKDSKRPLGKLFAGNYYGPFLYSKDDILYYDCAVRLDGCFKSVNSTEEYTGARGLEQKPYSNGTLPSVAQAWAKVSSPEGDLMLLNCKGINDLAFMNCDKIKRVSLQSYYEGVALDNIFGSGSSESYKMELNHEKIGRQAFYGSSITELRGTPATVGAEAFRDCKSLSSIDLSCCDSVGEGAFYESKVSTVKSLSGTDYIGPYAFSNCTNLSDSLALNVDTIHQYTFYGAPLTGVSLGTDCKAVKERAFVGGKFHQLTADGVKNVGQEAFADVPLKNLQMKGVEFIGISAFSGCFQREEDDESEFTITLGKNLIAINKEAFANAKGLQDPNNKFHSGITMKGNVPLRVATDAFQGVTTRYVKLQVPTDYHTAYAASTSFRDFNFSVDMASFPLLWEGVGSGYVELAADGTLTVTGTQDYDSPEQRPWHSVVGLVKKVVVNEDITQIGDNMFQGMVHLTTVDMGATEVQSIGNYAFAACPELKDVTLPSALTSIGDAAFNGDANLRNLMLPTTLTHIGRAAFASCKHLTGQQDLPNLTVIEPQTFYDTRIEGVVLGADLTRIGEEAFAYCKSLAKVVTPQVTPAACALNAFQEANPQMTLVCPDDGFLYYLADEVWSQLKMTHAQHGEVLVRDYMRVNPFDTSLPYVLFSDGLFLCSGQEPALYDTGAEAVETAIRQQWGNRIKRVQVMGESYVPQYLFRGLTALDSVQLDPAIKVLHAGTFAGCTSLKRINLDYITTLADGWETSGGGVFEGCTALTHVELMNLRKLGINSFRNCTSLREVYFGLDSLEVGSSAFENCQALEAVELGNTDKFGSGVFKGCTNLKEMTVNCRNLYEGMFADCRQLHKVTLGKHIWRSLSGADEPVDPFLNTALDTICITTPTPPILDEWCFGSVKRNRITCLVPADFIEEYQKAPVWKDFILKEDTAYMGNMFPIGEALSVAEDKWMLDRFGIFSIDSRNYDYQVLFTNGGNYTYCRSYVKKMVLGERTRKIGCFPLLLLFPPDFYNLTELTLGEDLELIDMGGFNTFNNLQRINCYASEPPALGSVVRVDGSALDYTGYNAYVFPDKLDYANTELHVLATPGVEEAYSAADVWKDFKIIPDLQLENFANEAEMLNGVLTAIEEIPAPRRTDSAFGTYYSLDGRRLEAPQRGINIVRKTDGTTVKVVRK